MLSPEQRPSFAKDFPADASLDALLEAFVRGDYASVRRRAPEVVRASEDPSVKSAAETLALRTRADPMVKLLLALAAALLVLVGTWWMVNGRPPHP